MVKNKEPHWSETLSNAISRGLEKDGPFVVLGVLDVISFRVSGAILSKAGEVKRVTGVSVA